MPQNIAPASAPQNSATGYLTALAVGYFIAAGVMAQFTLFSGFFNADIQSAMAGAFAGGNADEQRFLQMFTCVSWTLWSFELALTLLFLLTGFNMLRRRSRKLCLEVAAFACLLFPLGTILGIFTLVVLLKPEVKAMFEGASKS